MTYSGPERREPNSEVVELRASVDELRDGVVALTERTRALGDQLQVVNDLQVEQQRIAAEQVEVGDKAAAAIAEATAIRKQQDALHTTVDDAEKARVKELAVARKARRRAFVAIAVLAAYGLAIGGGGYYFQQKYSREHQQQLNGDLARAEAALASCLTRGKQISDTQASLKGSVFTLGAVVNLIQGLDDVVSGLAVTANPVSQAAAAQDQVYKKFLGVINPLLAGAQAQILNSSAVKTVDCSTYQSQIDLSKRQGAKETAPVPG